MKEKSERDLRTAGMNRRIKTDKMKGIIIISI